MAELSTEDIQFIKELRKAKEEGHISRRDALKGAGVLGVGSLLGGLDANEVVGSASADASTDDEDGDIGTPDNRVDVFADGVDSNTIQTTKLNGIEQAKTASDIESLVPDEDVDIVKIKPGTYDIDNPITLRGTVIGSSRLNGVILKKQNDDVLIETGGFLAEMNGLQLYLTLMTQLTG